MKGTLGRYQLLDELGRGAMGTVYRAADPLIGREVAIKTLHATFPEEMMQDLRERFLREARSAGKLSHPNIVTVFDVGEHEGIAYIAMELLPGRSLQQMLRAGPALPLETAVDFAAQLADALDHAHEAAVVHRDVKPANVIVSPAGRCKLTDFGVAHLASSTMTQVGDALGTPRYMSPEQALGQKPDTRSDIFSLGIVLYEMLVRRTPFERSDDTSPYVLMNRIAAEPHPPLRKADPRMPAALERIIDRALAKKPEGRYRRAAEMARELRAYRSLETGVHARAYQTTVLAPRDDAATVVMPRAEPARDALLDDLDAFVKSWDKQQAELEQLEQQSRREAEAQERVRLEEEAKRAAAARAQAQPAPGDARWQALGGRTGALDILKKQAAAQPAREAPPSRDKQQVALDTAMRAAFHYFAELANELNAVEPPSALPYEYLYLGRLPAVRLSRADVDSRPAHIPGRDVCALVKFRYQVTPDAPASATLLGPDIERAESYLQSIKVPYEMRALAKNDFGRPSRAVFSSRGPLPCEILIRADYDALVAELELLNVRRFGRTRCRLSHEQLREAIDDLARYMLGADDEFLRFAQRA